MFALSASCLEPSKRASFAAAARLLSCLVTESLLKAFFVASNSKTKNLKGIAIVLNSDAVGLSMGPGPFRTEEVFAVIPLRHIPFLKERNIINLLDPLDMLPYVYELKMPENDSHPTPNGFPKVRLHIRKEANSMDKDDAMTAWRWMSGVEHRLNLIEEV